MKTHITIIFLLSWFGLATGVVAATNQRSMTPEDFVAKSTDQQWFAYRVKAQEGVHSMCCWSNDKAKTSQCDLEKESYSYGNRNDSLLTDTIIIYTNIVDGKVKKLLNVGDHCEVETGNQLVTWLKNVRQSDSLSWLDGVARLHDEQLASSAIQAMALHNDQQASGNLYKLASTNAGHQAKNAIFWLGEVRNDGFNYLKKLHENLPKGEVRRQINFALSVSDDSSSVDLLKNIAQNDQDIEQRADAMFWLSQNQPPGITAFLLNAINNDESTVVREKAVFSLSQINTPQATEALVDVATDDNLSVLNGEALFWLSQVNPHEAKKVVFDVLKNSQDQHAVNQAVFALSQLSEQDNDQALFDVVKGQYSSSAKKQALFWLSQSDNRKTQDRLMKLL